MADKKQLVSVVILYYTNTKVFYQYQDILL